MRLKLFAPVLAALGLLVGAGTSQAGLFGSCCQPACNPEPCCYPKVRYKTCYQNVECYEQRTCYKTVHKCVMKECHYTVCRQVHECVEKECRKVVCKPCWEEKQIKVCCGEWKCEQCFVPGKCVTRKCRLPDTCSYDPCTGCCRHCRGEKVCCQVQLPGCWKSHKVWCPREEVRTVRCCKMVQEEVITKVPVNICRTVREDVCKMVPVTICEKVPVCETVKVCKRVKVCVPVCDDHCRRSWFHRDHCCNSGSYDAGYAAPAMQAAPASEKIPAPTPAK